MRYVIAVLMLVILPPSVHAQPVPSQKADEKYIDELETGCAFGLTEMCDELHDLEQAGKFASLTICNRTGEPVRVATASEVGKVREQRIRARGWRSLAPDECHAFWEWPVKDAALHVAKLNLIYVVSESGRVWSGDDAQLCTPAIDFDITGDHKGDCVKRGYFNVDLFADRAYQTGVSLDLSR